MQTFTWNESLSTGVPSIDAQHKELIATFNDLSASIEQGKGGSAIKKLLVFLKYYAEWHFDHEEKCAAKHQCAIAETNAAAHAKFIQIFTDLQTKYRESDASEEVARQAHAALSDWLVSHIMKIDKQIGACVRAANA